MEYLGFWVTRTEIWPVNNKVEAIVNMTPPINQKQVRSYIGLVHWYRYMCSKQAPLLKPLTALTSKKVKFKWTFVEQKSFYEIKWIVTHDTLLIYPDFNKRFDVHADASELNIGSVIIQDGKPISFCSRKLTKPQQQYTVT